MGMTIANPIQTLKYLRTSGVFPFSTKEGVLYLAESLDVVITTMRKYQKIQEILKDDTYYEEYGNNAEKFIVSAISEIIKDAGR